eukprot:13685238-Ditylum_brightwellii.AAC.1
MKPSTWKKKETMNKTDNIDESASNEEEDIASISKEDKEEKPLDGSILEEAIRTNNSGYDSFASSEEEKTSSNNNTEKRTIANDS